MNFTIKALDSAGGLRVYALDAPDEADARRQVLALGHHVVALSERTALWRAGSERINLIHFSQELVALLDAGLSLVEAIEALTEKETAPGARRTLEHIRSRLFEGRSLSAALADLPHSFPALYIATIKASERSGAIREAIVRYVIYQQQIDVLRKKVISASIYPLVLLVAGTAVTLFLLAYVVPRFSGIYQDIGGELPFASRMLMQWGQLLESHGGAVLIVAACLAAAVGYGVSRREFRGWIGAQVARLPTVGRQLHTYQLARLYRTVGMLLRGGMPAVTALTMSEGLLSAALRPSLVHAIQAVREGQSMANSLERFGLTTTVAVRMLRVGERSGNMGEMMERVAAFYDEEMARAVDILTRLIEPLLMSIIGLVIGVIVVLMYFPIFELAGSMQ